MRTEQTLMALERELSTNLGDELEACRYVGVSMQFVSQWRKDDKEVDARLNEAARVGTLGLYSAAVSRAVHGVEKGIYYKGVKVDTEQQYSDTLLAKLLEAKLPEFRKGSDANAQQTNVQVNVALMPRAGNYDEWLAMKAGTLKHLEDQRANALSADASNVIDVEYSEAPPTPPQSVFAGIEL